ncbi:MAG: PhzF family phenazine biosynthesis isomerase [Nitriliruptorales bacterium]|nr:PhzF family phenazine biosynthesis isomerase [Nitriliruptorales bacterium]
MPSCLRNPWWCSPVATAFHTLDVFTDRRFGGNPLAVLPDASGLSVEQMQQVAREFNLSETAFVLPTKTPDAQRRVRIFTPAGELPFAGHPTVGSAVLLVDLGLVPAGGAVTRFVLEEQIGPVAVTVTTRRGRAVSAQLEAPQLPVVTDRSATTDQIAAVLSLPAAAIGTPQLEPQLASGGVPFLVVPVADPRVLARISFDLGAWQRHLAGTDDQNMYVVRVADESVEARMFGPAFRIPEDPATGAAAVALGGYLAQHAPDGAHRWVVTQGVEMGRPSRIELDVEVADGLAVAVHIGGNAVRVADGTLRVTGYAD